MTLRSPLLRRMLALAYALIVSFVLANSIGQVDGVHAIALITSTTSVDPTPPSSQLVHIDPALIPSTFIDTPTSTFSVSTEISHSSGVPNPDHLPATSTPGDPILTQSSKPSLGSTPAVESDGVSKTKSMDAGSSPRPVQSPVDPIPPKVQHSIPTMKLVLLFVFMTVALTVICIAQGKSCPWSAVSLPRALSSRNARETASGRTTAVEMRNMPAPGGNEFRRRTTNENLDPDSTETLPQYTPPGTFSRMIDASSRVLSSFMPSATDLNRAIPDPETAPPAYNRAAPPAYSPSPLNQVTVVDEVMADDEVPEDYASDTSESDIGDVMLDSLSESNVDHTHEIRVPASTS